MATPPLEAPPPARAPARPVLAVVLALLLPVPLAPLAGAILGWRAAGQGRRLGILAIVSGLFATVLQVVAALLIPGLLRYGEISRVAEANVTLYALAAGLRDYVARHGDFPPAGEPRWVPDARCCAAPGGVCVTDASTWSGEPWKALGWVPPNPQTRYQYRYERTPIAGAGSRIVLDARADLGCDGHWTTLRLTGTRTGSASADIEIRGLK